MRRCYFACSTISVALALLVQNEVSAHGLTDKEWAMTFLAYSKVCGQLYPEKKTVYQEAIRKIKATDLRLGSVIETIEKNEDQMKQVTEFSDELPQDKKDIESECSSLEEPLSK